jgi:DNA-binding Xre family transcriptional regulator
MSATRVNRRRLELELARRGWNCSDLCRASGVSAATLSSAINGKPIAHRTLVRIAVALERQPIVAAIDRLLGEPVE